MEIPGCEQNGRRSRKDDTPKVAQAFLPAVSNLWKSQAGKPAPLSEDGVPGSITVAWLDHHEGGLALLAEGAGFCTRGFAGHPMLPVTVFTFPVDDRSAAAASQQSFDDSAAADFTGVLGRDSHFLTPPNRIMLDKRRNHATGTIATRLRLGRRRAKRDCGSIRIRHARGLRISLY